MRPHPASELTRFCPQPPTPPGPCLEESPPEEVQGTVRAGARGWGGGRLYLEGFQEGVEVDEDDPGDFVLPGVHEEQHVRDAQEGEKHQSGLHSLPGMRQVGGEAQSHSPPRKGAGASGLVGRTSSGGGL